jgi:hypothetical protein
MMVVVHKSIDLRGEAQTVAFDPGEAVEFVGDSLSWSLAT